MTLDLSFWRFAIVITIAKSLLWARNGDIWLFHIGQFSKEFPLGRQSAWQIIILMFSLKIGFARFTNNKE